MEDKPLIKSTGLIVKEVNDTIQVEVPGFSYGEFDRHGKVAAWNISKFMELSRFILVPLDHSQHKSVFAVNCGERLVVSRAFYQNATLQYPMLYKIDQSTRQEKSFLQNLSLCEKDSGLNLVTTQRQLIFIDKLTRKAVQIPDSSPLSKYPESSERFHISVATKPDLCFTTLRTVHFSDYDLLNHVNSTSYIKWMIDAAAEAAAKGALTSVRENFDHCAEVVEILFRKESFVRDKLSVHLWEEEPLCLCFNIQKEGEFGLLTFGRIKVYKDLFKSQI